MRVARGQSLRQAVTCLLRVEFDPQRILTPCAGPSACSSMDSRYQMQYLGTFAPATVGPAYPVRGNYINVAERARSYPRRPHFSSVPTALERSSYEATHATWTVDALRQTIKLDDPASFRLLDKFLNRLQWEQLNFAVGVAGGYPYGGCAFPGFQHVSHLVQGTHPPEVRAWAIDLCYRVGIYSYEVFFPINRDFIPPESFTFRLDVPLLMRHLRGCSEFADALLPLCDPNSPQRGVLAADLLSETHFVYEALRPAADLWRQLPEELITKFVQLGGAAELIANADKYRAFELQRQVSEVGFMLDDNPAHKDPDVARWWRWTDLREYNVHSGIQLLDSSRVVRQLRAHIRGACAAFDPSKRSNVEALAKLDKQYAEWGPIIKDLAGVHRLLVEQKNYLDEVILACRTSKGSAERTPAPARPTYLCPEMPAPRKSRRSH